MKSIVVATALVLSVASASAADLAARPYTKAPTPMLAAAYDWSGFYVGASAGYGWADVGHQSLNTNGSFWVNPARFGGLQTVRPGGAVYGGQVGYNWQSSNWVFGLEAAGFGVDMKRTDNSLWSPGFDLLAAKVDALFTATGRVGYAFNNWLPYIKGGYAGARVRTINSELPGVFVFDVDLDHSQWRNGFVIGGGVEYALTSNWIVGVEYNYMDFGGATWTQINRSRTTGAPFQPTQPESFRDDVTMQTVTARLSYKFGGPVLARY